MPTPVTSAPETLRTFIRLDGRWRVLIHNAAWQKMIRHRQSGKNKNEAGGQLFGKIDPGLLTVEVATGPSPSDIRSRFGFRPSRSREQKDINTYFKQGIHFLGNWHTHPEKWPHPSGTDLRSITDEFKRSEHQLEFFLMALVGTSDDARGFRLSGHDTTVEYIFKPIG